MSKIRGLGQRRDDVMLIVIIVFVFFFLRLFYLQVVNSSYRISADNNAFRHVTQYPARGLIYDRWGALLVYNEPVYDLMVIPGQVKAFDTLGFCQLIDMSLPDFRNRLAKARNFSRYATSVFEKQLSKETYGQLQEHLFKFRGFYVQSRTLRHYPQPIAAHVLGYIGEVNDKQVTESDYYRSGDYIGISGLERFYEEYLRGNKGNKILMVDVHNREKGSYRDGMFDTPSEAGLSLYSTLDMEVQALAEALMQNKRGSIVAIEPATGEIIAFVSAPTYDPNLLVGRVRSANYQKLFLDPQKPLFDRTLMAYYPPGSIFKTVQALVALQHGLITPQTGFSCDKSLVGCHAHPDAVSVEDALKMSCNPYFHQVFRRIVMQGKDPNRFVDSRLGLEMWEKDVMSFGFGQRLEIDLPNAKKGLIPNVPFYDKIYGANQWAFSTIRSLSIGQGEVGLIPLQMANLAAIIANRGFYITPHLCRRIGDTLIPNADFVQRHYVSIDPVHFEPVVRGMYGAVHEAGGTARRARIDSIAVCGKTGTSENPHGKDHSVFMAFAPQDKPQIAISVFVENAGFGGTWAAPIASLLIEKYLTREVKRKDLQKMVTDATFDAMPKKP